MNLREFEIELCGVCNATCTYCTWQERTAGQRAMDIELVHRLQDEASKLGLNRCSLHGIGEATLHPNFCEIIRRGEQLGIQQRLSTNAKTLKGKIADAIAGSNLELVLSVHWVMGERFVEACIKNIDAYCRRTLNNQVVIITMVCHVDAEPFGDRFLETFVPMLDLNDKIQVHLKQPNTWPNDTPNMGFIMPTVHDRIEVDTRATPMSLGQGCLQPENYLMSLSDGTYVPCCTGMEKSWDIGNAHELGIMEAWNSDRMEEVRRLWRTADPSTPCGHCLRRTDCLT